VLNSLSYGNSGEAAATNVILCYIINEHDRQIAVRIREILCFRFIVEDSFLGVAAQTRLAHKFTVMGDCDYIR